MQVWSYHLSTGEHREPLGFDIQGTGSGMRANVKALPSQVKAEVVYSADWRPCFFLNVGYLARPSKKLRKAVSKCRRACWGGTQETSCNQP